VYRVVLAPHELRMVVLDVGKGGAVLVQTPRGATILIDTGPNASILRVLGAALPPWKRQIDTIILTGTKTTFVGGLPDIEQRYHVRERIYIGNSATPYGTELTLDKNVLVTIISPGTFSISSGTTVLLISSSTPKGVRSLLPS
jgi:beta-lactamase superfamily II metal-dependent hydrolase